MEENKPLGTETEEKKEKTLDQKLQNFHGIFYTTESWGNTKYKCCRLCKTKNRTPKFRHWSKGLCRSCYRRLSFNHRLYNDAYNKSHARTVDTRKSEGKKVYKLDPNKKLNFDPKDVETVLVRYDFKCAYCSRELQAHTHTEPNAMQIEYILLTEDLVSLVLICRGCNCSKKNLVDEEKLKRWAIEKSIHYPFKFNPL